MVSCNSKIESDDSKLGEFPIRKNFIRSYSDPPTGKELDLYVELFDRKEPYKVLDQLSTIDQFSILCNPKEKSQEYYFVYNSQPTADEVAIHEKYCQLAAENNDENFNRRCSGGVHAVQYVRTESLHIISDADYDESHPAGTLLDDLVDVAFASAEDYLLSGYKMKQFLGKTTRYQHSLPEELYNTPDGLSREGGFLIESLSEFNQIQRKLIQLSFRFRFTSPPDVAGNHNFTIIYKNTVGGELTGTTSTVWLPTS